MGYLPTWPRLETNSQPEITLVIGAGARFSKDPVTSRARNQILEKSRACSDL